MIIEEQIRKKIQKYFQEKFGNNGGSFIPGQTPILASGKIFDEKEMQLMVEAVLDGWWTEGRFNQEFEQKLAQWIGRKYCITVNSGSSANLLALTALTSFKLGDRRLKKNDEVITVAAGFPTTINPIVANNLRIVFIDVDLGTYNANVNQIEKAISKKTKAIFLAHTLGNPIALNEISKICRQNNLWLIEDNCDALGSVYGGRKTGSFGHIATQSFYPAHHITMGEGGALLTDDPLLKKIIVSLRDWGRDCHCHTGHDNTCKKRYCYQLGSLPYGYDHKYIYSEIGYNMKITDMQAALGVVQLDKLDDFIQKRKNNFNFLYKEISNLEDYFILPRSESLSQPSWFGFLITLRNNCFFSREELLRYLDKYKISTRLLFAGDIIKQPYFKNNQIKFRKISNLKNTDKIMNDSFWIGVYPGLNQEKLDFVIEKFNDFARIYGKRKNKYK